MPVVSQQITIDSAPVGKRWRLRNVGSTATESLEDMKPPFWRGSLIGEMRFADEQIEDAGPPLPPMWAGWPAKILDLWPSDATVSVSTAHPNVFGWNCRLRWADQFLSWAATHERGVLPASEIVTQFTV